MDQSSELLIALTSRDLSQDIPALKSRDLWSILQRASDRSTSLDVLFGGDGDWEAEVGPGLRDTIAARLELRERAAEYADGLLAIGIWVSTPFEESWPQRMRERLGGACPIVLYGAGSQALLAEDGIGVVGSRNLGPEGETAAEEVAVSAIRAGLSVISGGARGVDRVAMSKALDAGGRTVGVLAHPLTRTMRDSSTAVALAEASLCLVTPFKPDAGFSVGNAMARNKLIYALSRVTAVVASDHGSGGTWTGAVEALDRGFGEVAVWRGPGEGPGNAALADRAGAIPIADTEVLVRISPGVRRQGSLL